MEIAQHVSVSKLLKWYFSLFLIFSLSAFSMLAAIYAFGEDENMVSVSSLAHQMFQDDFYIYLLVGIVAQLIDGSLGMAYGVSSTSFLISAGVSPVAASTSVHIAEVFTTGISGLSHWKFGNVDRAMFKKLVIPGAIGAALGAYFLTSFDGNLLKPFVSGYLLIMGLVILAKSFRKTLTFSKGKNLGLLGFAGGFMDASGGGGWGPVVTTSLIGSGKNPKNAIGTVNAVEFIVALTASGIFTLFAGSLSLPIIAGLMAGGAIAAPLGAYLCIKINIRAAMVVVGLLIIGLSLRVILNALHLI